MNRPDAEHSPIPASDPHADTGKATWVRLEDGGQTLEENWLFRLRRERHRSRATGKDHDYYVVHLADAVSVIALTPDRRILLVEQFRAGSGLDSLETPGGLLGPGEDPLEAGARELLEETGYAGDPPTLIGTVWSNPSILSSRITTILITNARPVAEPSPDPEEELRMELVPARDVPRMIREGRIGHALSVQGLLWWLLAELPDTPLSLPDASRPGRGQFHIGKAMVTVAALAVVLALLRPIGNLGAAGGSMFLFALLLPLSHLLIDRFLDPMPRATITRLQPALSRRSGFRSLATLGLNLLLWAPLTLLLMYLAV